MSITWKKETVSLYVGRNEQGKPVMYQSSRPAGYVEPEEEKPEPKVKCSPRKVKHNM